MTESENTAAPESPSFFLLYLNTIQMSHAAAVGRLAQVSEDGNPLSHTGLPRTAQGKLCGGWVVMGSPQ